MCCWSRPGGDGREDEKELVGQNKDPGLLALMRSKRGAGNQDMRCRMTGAREHVNFRSQRCPRATAKRGAEAAACRGENKARGPGIRMARSQGPRSLRMQAGIRAQESITLSKHRLQGDQDESR